MLDYTIAVTYVCRINILMLLCIANYYYKITMQNAMSQLIYIAIRDSSLAIRDACAIQILIICVAHRENMDRVAKETRTRC